MTKLEHFKAWATDRHPHMPQDTMERNGEPFFYHDMLQMAWRAFQHASNIRPTPNMDNGKLDKAALRKDNPETIVDRLNGVYPQIDPPYKMSPIHYEAAREIERLREKVRTLEED